MQREIMLFYFHAYVSSITKHNMHELACVLEFNLDFVVYIFNQSVLPTESALIWS